MVSVPSLTIGKGNYKEQGAEPLSQLFVFSHQFRWQIELLMIPLSDVLQIPDHLKLNNVY